MKEDRHYKVKPDIRKMLIFAHHDIVKNPPYCNMDFISCRNMLIYMTPVLQKKIFDMLLYGLKKDRYLFLGPSENPVSILDSLDIVDKKWKIYKNIKEKQPIRFDAYLEPALLDVKSKTPPLAVGQSTQKDAIADSVPSALMFELGYTMVCIDEHNQVVQTFGDTTKYLRQKNFTVTLTDLLPKPLAVAFTSACRKALQSNEKILVKSISIENNPVPVNLLVKALDIKKSNKKLLLVAFSDDNTSSPMQQPGEVFDKKIFLDEYVLNMEEELRELREEVRGTHEKLEASDQNSQSYNEELLSANEEMQSTNEEMQSINEELHTINADYQAKNKELVEINDDLDNYFRSNVNGQLFVNRDILLMKFSPGTVQHINLQNSDIGRPLSNISTNIKFDTIISDVKEVITNGGIITKEVEAVSGKWYQIMTMPYVRQADNQTD
ncbi:MAG: CheR family methyltransferase, partial [Segetibacter sp.]